MTRPQNAGQLPAFSEVVNPRGRKQLPITREALVPRKPLPKQRIINPIDVKSLAGVAINQIGNIGSAKTPPSVFELLSQPVSSKAAAQVRAPSQDNDGEIRAVGMPSIAGPQGDKRYPIPYIQRRHSFYYSTDEVAAVTASILDRTHARQVLARVVGFPRWMHFGMAFGCALGAAGMSLFNGFLSFICFIVCISICVLFSHSMGKRVSSGRFYDRHAMQVSWAGSFGAVGALAAVVAARGLVPQPWLAIITLVVATILWFIWFRGLQIYQIKRLLRVDAVEVQVERDKAIAAQEQAENMLSAASTASNMDATDVAEFRDSLV